VCIAYLKSKLSVMRNETWMFSELPWHKTAVTYFQDPMTKDQIAVISSHLPLKFEERTTLGKRIAENISNIPLKKLKSVIWTGDFNAFSDYGGFEQMTSLMITGGLTDATAFARNVDGKRQDVTFLAYAYDTFPPPEESNKLDYILVRGRGITCASPQIHNDLPLEVNGKKYGASDHFPVECTLLY